MKSKRITLILTLVAVLVSLTGCFKFTDSLLATLFPQPKNEVKEEEPEVITEVVPAIQTTVIVQGRTLTPNLPEYRWWYAGYYNLSRYPFQYPPPPYEQQLLRWYGEGRRCWWEDNINPILWPRLELTIERRNMVPRAPKEGIDRYVDHGVPTGSFLLAVLSNDLFEAVARADEYNQLALVEICRYIHDYTPNTCHGSPERVAAWLKFHRDTPVNANLAASEDRCRRETYYTKP